MIQTDMKNRKEIKRKRDEEQQRGTEIKTKRNSV